VIRFILGQARRERLGEVPMTAETVDEGIKLWLSRKGLGEKEDLEKIEQLGGTLTRGLLMVLHALPRHDKDEAKATPARRPGNGSESKVRCSEKFDVQRHSALTEFVNGKVKERERKYTNLAANLSQENPGIPSTFNPMSNIEQKASPGLPKYEVVDEVAPLTGIAYSTMKQLLLSLHFLSLASRKQPLSQKLDHYYSIVRLQLITLPGKG
jgi:hypothetical protein